MFISGIGFISGEGIGLQALRESCAASSPAPEIDDGIIKAYKFPRDMRRADRFSRLCMIAGNEALKDSGVEADNCGIILATALGPHETTFSFLGDLIDYSGAEVSPTKFSHSVHNAAASYASIFCGVNEFSLTVVGFDNPWAKAMLAAEIMLEQQQADKVLLIGADEKKLLAELLEKLDKSAGSLVELPRNSIECAAGMLLTAAETPESYCRISALEEKDTLIFSGKPGLVAKLPFAYSGNAFFGNALDCAMIAVR
jgi:hypothetical protein